MERERCEGAPCCRGAAEELGEGGREWPGGRIGPGCEFGGREELVLDGLIEAVH